jgi:ubiquinone/menaquinone biosynthesis C-methylase UbiE
MNDRRWWHEDRTVDYFRQKPADPLIVERLSQITDREHKAALDLGCGGGRHSEMLVGFGFSVSACDVNDSMVNATKTRLPEIVERIVHASMLSLPFADTSFDCIVSTGVFHQATTLAEYQTALAEASRVMRPGGILAMNIFVRDNLDDSLTLTNESDHLYTTRENLQMILLTPDEFTTLAGKAGLRIESVADLKVVKEPTGTRTVWKAFFVKE